MAGSGVPVDTLRRLADHWRTGFDWRAQERRLNDFDQYRTTIDGQDLHFLHVHSPEPHALPLLLTHGWPNSFVEFSRLIGPLTEPRAHGGDPSRAFHMVVPSVPGFGFSAPPRDTGWTPRRVAGLWTGLMRRLGYGRYGVQGGDLGAYIAPEVALADPDRVAGVYVISGLGFPTEADVPELDDTEPAVYQALQQADWMHGVDHHGLLRAAPQTFSYGWQDSPAAALAWMAQKFHDFNASGRPLEEAIDRDLFLTNLSVYWFTGTFDTSAWPYYDSTASGWPTGQQATPTGVYSGPPGIRRLAERHNIISHWPHDNPPGHHFIAMDQPAALAADLATFFAPLR
jgi:pimeloyl-ACP methyl ester carboxylesterase